MDRPPIRPNSVLDTLPCSLPTRNVPTDIDIASICHVFSGKIAKLGEGDFTRDAMWRDMFALSSTLRTFYSAAAIIPTWHSLCCDRGAGTFEIKCETASVKSAGPQTSWIEVSLTFSLALPLTASCLGYLCLVLDEDDEWKVWILGTILDQIPNFGDVDRLNPVESIPARCLSSHSDHINKSPRNAASSSNPHQQQQHKNYGCVIIGGGQSGICTAGRLEALGVSYICVESSDEVGDSWRLRYDSSKRMITLSISQRQPN